MARVQVIAARVDCLRLRACWRRRSAARAQFSYDVPYVPTPPVVVEEMLRLANVGPADFVIDLGSGDGRILIAAAEKIRRARRRRRPRSRPHRGKRLRRAARRRIRPRRVPAAGSVQVRHQPGDGGDDVPAAVGQPQAAAAAPEGTQARHAHRVARFRYAGLAARPEVHGAQERVPVDRAGAGGAAAGAPAWRCPPASAATKSN